MAGDTDFSGMLQLQRSHALRLAMSNRTPSLGSFISPFQTKMEADPLFYFTYLFISAWDDGHSPKIQSRYCRIPLL